MVLCAVIQIRWQIIDFSSFFHHRKINNTYLHRGAPLSFVHFGNSLVHIYIFTNLPALQVIAQRNKMTRTDDTLLILSESIYHNTGINANHEKMRAWKDRSEFQKYLWKIPSSAQKQRGDLIYGEKLQSTSYTRVGMTKPLDPVTTPQKVLARWKDWSQFDYCSSSVSFYSSHWILNIWLETKLGLPTLKRKKKERRGTSSLHSHQSPAEPPQQQQQPNTKCVVHRTVYVCRICIYKTWFIRLRL